jgi:hypothetical protein
MLWIYYALIKSDECLLITINSAGCVIETIYIVVYLVYAPKKGKVCQCSRLVLVTNCSGTYLLGITRTLTDVEMFAAVHGKDHAAPERGGVWAHRPPDTLSRRRGEAPRPPRLGLRRLLCQRLRRAT